MCVYDVIDEDTDDDGLSLEDIVLGADNMEVVFGPQSNTNAQVSYFSVTPLFKEGADIETTAVDERTGRTTHCQELYLAAS